MKTDSRKMVYDKVDSFTLQDIKSFHANHLKGKNWTIRVIGSKDKINMQELSKYGKIVELSTKDIFGYEAEKSNPMP